MLESLTKDYEGFSNPVRFLMSQHDTDDLIKGVVADIIDVPREYVSAIERALGNAMQYIVTQSDFEAKKLISMLRNNRAGRATFLPLSAIRSRKLKDHEQSILNKQGCIGIAAELIDSGESAIRILPNRTLSSASF